MATETTCNARTLKGYVAELLVYPRWTIEREVDFTNCRRGGHHNEFLSECARCRFGAGCRWLDRHHALSPERASLDDLLAALEDAVACLGARDAGPAAAATREWLREAQRFLHTRPG